MKISFHIKLPRTQDDTQTKDDENMILTIVNLTNCWEDNTAGHLADLFAALTGFMCICIFSPMSVTRFSMHPKNIISATPI